jgi:N-acetyl-anhydromuramyl-L-alanine amidase AmpD
MIDITDKNFWNKIGTLAPVAEKTVKDAFNKVNSQPLTVEEAENCLDALLAYSHQRITVYSNVLKKYFPTVQFTKNRLQKVENLWWTDHYTGGISEMSTLNWFSAQKVTKKDGKKGLPGASTHFVLGRHGYPFYIIPIWHGAWHEPARNADSLSIELVNPGALIQTADGWARFVGSLPKDMVTETPPVRINPPYRGAKILMPFTVDQVVNLIKLKRIVLTLVKPRLVPERMTQHSVWRETKIDMGPLFPLNDVNRAAFEFIPVEQYDFIQRMRSSLPPGVLPAAPTLDDADEALNVEHGFDTPTQDQDSDDQVKILDVLTVQKLLATKGVYRGKLDGIFGSQTKKAVTVFQSKWNFNAPADKKLEVDGIPGPRTCQALQTN